MRLDGGSLKAIIRAQPDGIVSEMQGPGLELVIPVRHLGQFGRMRKTKISRKLKPQQSEQSSIEIEMGVVGRGVNTLCASVT